MNRFKRDQAQRCLNEAHKARLCGRFVRERTLQERATRLLREANTPKSRSNKTVAVITGFSPYSFDATAPCKSTAFLGLVQGCRAVMENFKWKSKQ